VTDRGETADDKKELGRVVKLMAKESREHPLRVSMREGERNLRQGDQMLYIGNIARAGKALQMGQ